MLSGGAVELFINTLAGVLTVVVFCVLPDIGVDVLVDVNANVFAGVMTTFEFAMPGPLEDFRR